jgi:hypothetical protein
MLLSTPAAAHSRSDGTCDRFGLHANNHNPTVLAIFGMRVRLSSSAVARRMESIEPMTVAKRCRLSVFVFNSTCNRVNTKS